MVSKITIERECQHKILFKQGLVLIITAVEFVNNINELGKKRKLASTNVSIINDNCGPQLSKIGGIGDTIEEAYKDCLNNFNRNRDFCVEENKILLCCSEIPFLELDDLQNFVLTRTFKFSWINNGKCCLLKAYVRKEKDHLIFTYDGTETCHIAKSDKEIIKFILDHGNFNENPVAINNKLKGKLFYPTIQEFLR